MEGKSLSPSSSKCVFLMEEAAKNTFNIHETIYKKPGSWLEGYRPSNTPIEQIISGNVSKFNDVCVNAQAVMSIWKVAQ